jgi:hypothetical protein
MRYQGRSVGLHDIHLGALLDDVGPEECLVADHAREGEPVHRPGRAVVVAAAEAGVAGDGEDLLEVVHLLQRRGRAGRWRWG